MAAVQWRRCPWRREGGCVGLLSRRTCEDPHAPAGLQSAATNPFALAIQHPANRLAAVRATVTRLIAAQLRGALVAPRPRAAGIGKKFLLRDHAPPQLPAYVVLATKVGHAAGAHVAPPPARLSQHHPGAVAPAAVPPASGGPAADIRGPGSNAGSNTAADTCGHNPCAGTSGPALVADWHSALA